MTVYLLCFLDWHSTLTGSSTYCVSSEQVMLKGILKDPDLLKYVCLII